MKKIAILLAGGSGERFWPVSRLKKPKQLLPLNSNKPLIEEAIERITTVIPLNDIYIFTNLITYEPIKEVLHYFPKENIIPEPLKRNTAPALAYAMSFILSKYGQQYKNEEILVGVFTSDQKIDPIDKFQQTIEVAFEYVSKNPKIATIGIVPTRPDTAFGYIEVGNALDSETKILYEVQRFREKPDFETAKKYIEQGNYYWNSGMFFWRLDTFLYESQRYMPLIFEKIFSLKAIFEEYKNFYTDQIIEKILPIFDSFPDISIDYALMEKTKNIVLVKSQFDWDDIGSWDALDRTKQKDGNGNVNFGNNLLIETSNSIVFNNTTCDGLKVCLVGMENVVVVVTNDAVLVCAKEQVQKVKKCVEELKKNSEDKYL
ncbi:MAG: sugar phosphate nucleotidyltransferase [Ignavibacteria bacterium]|nr:sugar phosphate nucleotidyltransferase [Ignavibacteria bacterium]